MRHADPGRGRGDGRRRRGRASGRSRKQGTTGVIRPGAAAADAPRWLAKGVEGHAGGGSPVRPASSGGSGRHRGHRPAGVGTSGSGSTRPAGNGRRRARARARARGGVADWRPATDVVPARRLRQVPCRDGSGHARPGRRGPLPPVRSLDGSSLPAAEAALLLPVLDAFLRRHPEEDTSLIVRAGRDRRRWPTQGQLRRSGEPYITHPWPWPPSWPTWASTPDGGRRPAARRRGGHRRHPRDRRPGLRRPRWP